MTPARARELYETARTLPEVVELFQSRPERSKEANLLRSLHSKHISDPMCVIRILRGMATDDEEAERRYRDRGEVERAEERKRRVNALLWAASALTRGVMLGPAFKPAPFFAEPEAEPEEIEPTMVSAWLDRRAQRKVFTELPESC